MRDLIALPLLAILAVAMIGLALVWPQGQGTRSPGPFGQSAATAPANPMAASAPTKGARSMHGARP